MITEWLLGIAADIIGWLLGSLPAVQAPGWLTSITSNVSTVMGGVDGMSAWIPWPLLVTVGGACLASWLVGLTVKVVRIVASFVTLGGGSAA